MNLGCLASQFQRQGEGERESMWKRSGLCAGVSAALRDQGLDSVWFLFLDFPETGFLCLVLEFSLMTRLALNSLRLACLCLLAATEGMWSDPVLDQVLEGIKLSLFFYPCQAPFLGRMLLEDTKFLQS